MNRIYRLILASLALMMGWIGSLNAANATDYPIPEVNFLPYGSTRLLNITGFGSGSKLNTWTLNGEDNEDWRILYVSDSIYKIENVKTGLVITQDDCYATLGKDQDNDNQKWHITGTDKDFLGFYLYYKIENLATGDVLTFMSEGNVIKMENYTGAQNQKWKINLDGCQGFAGNCKVDEGEKACAIGGILGKVVYVSTTSEFVAEIKDNTPKIVVLNGNIDLGTEQWNQHIGFYKTIVGSYQANTIRDPYLRSDGQFADYDPSDNVVIQNINFTASSAHKDKIMLNIYSAKNWWVDHCTFVATEVGMDSAYYDVGKFIWINSPYPGYTWSRESEIPRSPDFVTLSYNIFRDRYWCIAYGTQNGTTTEDRTSVMFNTFEGCVRRMVQLGNGTLHEYNNFLNRTHTAKTGDGLACIIVGDGANAYLERNRFQGMRQESTGYTDQQILGDDNTTDVESYTDFQKNYVDGTDYTPYAINFTPKNSTCSWNPKSNYGYQTLQAYKADGKDVKGFCSTYCGSQTSLDKIVYVSDNKVSDFLYATVDCPFLTNTSVTSSEAADDATTAISKRGAGSSKQEGYKGDSIVPFSFEWAGASNIIVSGIPNGIEVVINQCAKTVSFSGALNDEVGTYQYSLTTVGGNPDSTRYSTFTIKSSDATSLNNVSANSDVKVTNIGHGEICITLANQGLSNTTIELYDIAGVKIFAKTVNDTQNIYVNNLTTGVYLLKVLNADGATMQKVVVK